MNPNPGKMNKIKGAFDKVVEWDKNLIKKCQDSLDGQTIKSLSSHLLKDLLLEQYSYD